MSRRGGELSCTTCHRAHRAQPGTAGTMLGTDTYSCLLCHTEEAAIAPTAHSTARAPGAGGGRSSPGVCAGCHGEHGWRLPVPRPAGEEDSSTVVERLCGVCHGAPEGAPYGGVTNHPVNVTVPGSGPGGPPLYWKDGRRLRNGVISCPTCHDVHRGGPAGRFLRPGARGGDQCLDCHAGQETVVGTKHDLSGTACSTCATGWTVLLLWGAAQPIERRAVLLIVVCPTILGIVAASVGAARRGVVQARRMVPLWIHLAVLSGYCLLVLAFSCKVPS